MTSFQEEVWEYYRHHGRHDLPWRVSVDPYHVMVSELMLQQTQVSRVIPKFNEFITKFPSAESLAAAPLSDVLTVWSGLGYNRRAKFLHQTAQVIADEYNGEFPLAPDKLIKLPGIGRNTAGAIMAYAYNQPVAFVETNIRTVFIHHFFSNQTDVSDKEILRLVEQTMDPEHPREWYWALMDYGTFLKKSVSNIEQSKHYTKQSKFHGSKRQIRGQVIRELTLGAKSFSELKLLIVDDRLASILNELVDEVMIQQIGERYTL
jgi:A/G-specific adenine glycosylase